MINQFNSRQLWIRLFLLVSCFLTASLTPNLSSAADGTDPAPSVSGFWPGNAANALPGNIVFVFGKHFDPQLGATKVAVNGINAPLLQVQDDTLLFFVLPAGDTNGPITVTTSLGSGASIENFNNPPTDTLSINGFWPGEVDVGNFVFVFGSKFIQGSTSVTVNDVSVPFMQVLSEDLLVFLVPETASTGLISITTVSPTGSLNFVSSKGNLIIRGNGNVISLIQLGDVHGVLAPHQEIFPGERVSSSAGGFAKQQTIIKQIREKNPDNLLLLVGDATQGTAETMFTLGDAVMPALNALNIDAFLPGNWDFGYGPRVFRNRFTGTNLPLPPNSRTTLSATKAGCAEGLSTCNVTPANFPSVAANLYNYNESTKKIGGLVLPPYIIKNVGNKNIAIIGLTSDVVPQQAKAFNIGFRFTMGFNELPGTIADAKAQGADLIVVLSELGMSKNIQLVKEFPAIDVMFSGHTHERTVEPIIINHPSGGFSIVTESGEDAFIGQLDLKLVGGKIAGYSWNLIELDDAIAEDTEMKAIVNESRKTFVAGPDFACHTFGAGGFAYGKGHTLCDPLDTVVGTTEVNLERFDVLEGIANNFMTDAFLSLGQQTLPELTDDNSLTSTNGFRFDRVIIGKGTKLPSGGSSNGDITIGALYSYYPIGAALAAAEFTGGRLLGHWEGILDHVFDRNPYRQRGGWFLGFPHNMSFEMDLVNLPLSISYAGRLTDVQVNGKKLDSSKVYTLVSCYPHGNPIDEVCRTTGARNLRFLAGTQSPNGTISTPYTTVLPLNTENILDPLRQPVILQVAPDNYVHPVDVIREYLKTNTVTEASHGLGRVTSVTGVPVSDYDPTLVQPVQGAGPDWLRRKDKIIP